MLDVATDISLRITGSAAQAAFVTYPRGSVRADRRDTEDRAENSAKLDFIANDLKDIKAANR